MTPLSSQTPTQDFVDEGHLDGENDTQSANRKTASAQKICPMAAKLYIIFILFINIKSIIKVEKKPGHHGPLH